MYLSISPSLNVLFVRFTLIRIQAIQLHSGDKARLIYEETIGIDNQLMMCSLCH